jgi:hypothetical protein
MIHKRQFITDIAGHPISVIEPHPELSSEAYNLDRMAQAVHGPPFMADLHETILAFAKTDAEWWEPTE